MEFFILDLLFMAFLDFVHSDTVLKDPKSLKTFENQTQWSYLLQGNYLAKQ